MSSSIIIIIWITNIIGIPYLKNGFLVLCLNTFIPIYPRGVPPKIHNESRVDSLTLYIFLIANNLSNPKVINVTTLIIIK